MATAPSTSSSASCARSSRSTRRAGPTSTPISGSATGLTPNRPGSSRGGWGPAPRGAPRGAAFTDRSQDLYGGVTAALDFPATLGAHGNGNREPLAASRRRAPADPPGRARRLGRRAAAEPDHARAAAARHPRRPPAADHDPRGALHRGLGGAGPP